MKRNLNGKINNINVTPNEVIDLKPYVDINLKYDKQDMNYLQKILDLVQQKNMGTKYV